jgi:hypothetical protein
MRDVSQDESGAPEVNNSTDQQTVEREPRQIDSRYIRMPVRELTTPHEGRKCMLDRWWHVTENDEVLFYKGYYSPQCNSDKSVVEHLTIAGCHAVFLSVAYVPHRCSDYV